MLDRRLRKKVERAFYDYPKKRLETAEKIADEYDVGLTAKIDKVGSSGSTTPNPTEDKAIRIVDNIQSDQWNRVVELTLERFSYTGKDNFIRMKYFDRKLERQICDKFYITQQTYFRWLEEVLTYAAMIAIQQSLLTVV